jgi:putative ABC transport system permease protein
LPIYFRHNNLGNAENLECRLLNDVAAFPAMLSDLRFALRSLAKTPGVTLIAAFTLAVGIGAATAMFSVLRALVVEPFSYPNADQVVQLWSNEGQPLSTPDYLDMREQATSFAQFGAYNNRSANLGGEKAQAVSSVLCTCGVLRAFGVAPALGRWFAAADDVPGAPPVAIISDGLWRQSFGGDPGLVGRTIRLDGADTTVVGVMPAGFEFASPWMHSNTCQVWMPLQLKRDEGERGNHWLCGVGRLKDGVVFAAANAEIKAIGARLKVLHPDTNATKPFFIRPLKEEMGRFIAPSVWMLFSAVVLVMLVACANVASMLLARGARRLGEFGIRVAMGASGARILRLVLTESLILALGGAVAGILLAAYGVRIVAFIAPITDTRKAALVLDGRVLAFAVAATLLTALLAGLPPALASLRLSVADLMRGDGRSIAGSRTRHNLLRGLIIAQVAVAFTLADAAALFSQSYMKLLTANEGLATEHVLSAEVNLQGSTYEKTEARTRFALQLAERAAALPGAAAAGTTTKLPLEGGSNMNILVNDEAFDSSTERVLAEISSVTPGYFDAAGIRMIRGRTLKREDAAEDNIGVVVNRALAEKCWPGQDPMGKVIRPDTPKAWFHARVVGVAEDVRQWGPAVDPKPELYWTPDRAWGQRIFLLVRSAHPAAQLAPLLRRELAAMDPDLPLAHIRTLKDVVHEATQAERVVAGMVDVFMAAALGLVAVGLYGTLSYHVMQRTREIGVRLAIGAERRNILRLVFRQGFGWVLIGVATGIAGSLALASVLRSLAWGIDPLSALSLLTGTAAVGAAATLACWLPAWRAARVDPIEALRAD